MPYNEVGANLKLKTFVFPYNTFAKPKILGAIVALAFGLVLLDKIFVVSILLFLLTIYLPFISDGLEVDLENGRYRIYKSRFGLKSGKWNSFKSYTEILLLLKRGKKGLVGARGAVATYHDHQEYEVVVANSTHRKQLLLKSFETKEQAEKFAQDFSEKLNLPITKFKPKISARTQTRRKKEKN